MFPGQAHQFLLGFLLLYVLCFGYTNSSIIGAENVRNEEFVTFIEVLNDNAGMVLAGHNVTLVCKTNVTQGYRWWMFESENVTDNSSYIVEFPKNPVNQESTLFGSFLHVIRMGFQNVGNYSCHIANDNVQSGDSIVLNITVPGYILENSPIQEVKVHSEVILYCLVEGYPIQEIYWLKDKDETSIRLLSPQTKINHLNDTIQNTTLHLTELSKKDNGNYSCVVSLANGENVSSEIRLLILDKPQVNIDFVKALGMHTVYLNWTVNNGNDPDTLQYQIQYMEDGVNEWTFLPERINGSVTHKVLEKVFKENTTYELRMEASNSQGTGQKSNTIKVHTLTTDPEFVPEIKVTGMTISSITVAWSQLPVELRGHVHYYQLKLWQSNSNTSTEAIQSTFGDHLYMFHDLIPATKYEFQVTSCSEYTNKCGPWSNKVNGTTLDGISEPPVNVSLICRFDNISHTSFVLVSWEPPKIPNGKIIHYNVILEGGAYYTNEHGVVKHATWGPKMTSVDEKTLSARFYNISANTNYTVKISAVTRTKKHGKHVIEHCTMPPTTPEKNKLSRFSWTRIEEQGKWMFKLFIPRMSERNGAICCYRVYMVRMESQKSLAEMPSPEDLHVSSYHEAHRTPRGGVYIAEMLSNKDFHSEIFLGDDYVLNYTNSPCVQCFSLKSNSYYKEAFKPMFKNNIENFTISPTNIVATTTTLPSTSVETVTKVQELINRVRRHYQNPDVRNEQFVPPIDGILDIGSNYTGFVEIIVYGSSKGEIMVAFSNYFSILNPGPQLIEIAPSTQVMSIVIKILCALILVVFVLLMALCLLHRYTKQVAHAQGVEMITFRNSFRHLCRSLRGRHRLVSLSPPDMSPIPKSELANVYLDRHKDSDYGFQREFELLPDRFADRTTRASDARENIYKNRYPDIKAYDQTRVKLAQIDSIAGSDYINANFVIGYKERKKFICAQGPMDNTVCDYWRMIWEQHLELILMLTNLEEYSKTKCAKYWPDKTEGEKIFGDITVTHVEEKRYSDYIVRQLHIHKDIPGRDREERLITQYHFLVWKDFMAPEHPHGIIKFIKRMNEAYSLERGSILVHCSAGVGRTGTLVALDSLLQQVNEEGQVAIFNTICDMRHQRNFLVQSLKQYIFIYRALMEVAQYGDTEISASELKVTVDKLKQQNDKIKCKMEEEFENIKNAVEDRKSNTVGGGEENHQKNRSDIIIPYDRNRVILTPIPGREHSTYINASFIEGYDNSESFIITQDPMDITIADYWRMISEQGICVIVMLSDLGDSIKKCPRYWPDDEINYDHIAVKYIQSESCPYYTRREFIVTNNKCDENVMVTQFQYHGWPTVEGEVPEVTRGLIELVDQTQAVQQQHGHTGPLAVHCNYGSDRSSMFVGLSILVQQLRVEKRVDVFTTTRKLRSQRQGMISTYAQYEFLHRAIVNYADLNQL